MKTIVLRLSVFAFSFAIGFALILSTKTPAPLRNPAAVRQYYDFTALRGSALEVALKERVVSKIEVVRNSSDLGLTFGHFAFTNAQNKESLGCEAFGKITLDFESGDMAISGEKSKMEVTSDCVASSDITMIEPVWIPISKIYRDKPTDGDFQFMEGKQTSLRFSNISDEWPKKWHLVRIHLNGVTQELTIDRNEVQKILGKPLVLSF